MCVCVCVCVLGLSQLVVRGQVRVVSSRHASSCLTTTTYYGEHFASLLPYYYCFCGLQQPVAHFQTTGRRCGGHYYPHHHTFDTHTHTCINPYTRTQKTEGPIRGKPPKVGPVAPAHHQSHHLRGKMDLSITPAKEKKGPATLPISPRPPLSLLLLRSNNPQRCICAPLGLSTLFSLLQLCPHTITPYYHYHTTYCSVIRAT